MPNYPSRVKNIGIRVLDIIHTHHIFCTLQISTANEIKVAYQFNISLFRIVSLINAQFPWASPSLKCCPFKGIPLLGTKFIVHQGKHKWDNQLAALIPTIEVQINIHNVI